MTWVDPSNQELVWSPLKNPAIHPENGPTREWEDEYADELVNISALQQSWPTLPYGGSIQTPTISLLTNPLLDIPFKYDPIDPDLTIDKGDTSSRPDAAPILYPRPT